MSHNFLYHIHICSVDLLINLISYWKGVATVMDVILSEADMLKFIRNTIRMCDRWRKMRKTKILYVGNKNCKRLKHIYFSIKIKHFHISFFRLDSNLFLIFHYFIYL